jgi:hypothetical protein
MGTDTDTSDLPTVLLSRTLLSFSYSPIYPSCDPCMHCNWWSGRDAFCIGHESFCVAVRCDHVRAKQRLGNLSLLTSSSLLYIKHQTSRHHAVHPEVLYRTSNIKTSKHQTSNIKHQTSNIKHQTSNIKHQTSNSQHIIHRYSPTLNILRKQCQIPEIHFSVHNQFFTLKPWINVKLPNQW